MMNVIGKFGRFIIEYQNPIQISLIVILIGLVIFFIIRAAINAKKKRELLAKINDTVSEINTTVSRISEKKSEVIYIDNRVPQAPGYPAPITVTEETSEAASGETESAAARKGEPAEAETAAQEATEQEAEAEAKPQAPAPKKFSDRDCAVSKGGRTYSIEELSEQIKE